MEAASAADVDAAVGAARSAFSDSSPWRTMSGTERGALMHRLADLMDARARDLATLETWDNGKPYAVSLGEDLPEAAACLRYYAGWADKVHGQTIPTTARKFAYTVAQPVGVCAQIVPWNYPLVMASWKLGPALAAGNTVVLKASEQCPGVHALIGACLHEAGLGDGVVNVVTNAPEDAGEIVARLIAHPAVRRVNFTGSTHVGRIIARLAAEHLKPALLELGGKAPVLVLDDADLDAAVDGIAFGAFFNQGQICSANSRLLVHESIAEDMIERLRGRAEALVPGNPLNPATCFGSMVSQEHADRVMHFIALGRKSCRLVTGGEQVCVGESRAFIQPTIFIDAPAESEIVREEIFGPVLVVQTFQDDAQAIALANDTPYGLAASVWTKDLTRALSVSDALHVGTVSVNTVDALSPMTPFGGLKQSGFGRDLSLHSFDKYSDLKTVWIKY